MQTYKVLKSTQWSEGNYSIVPIRMQDRYDIMKWRNEQMYHLRQHQLLTPKDQDNYFETVISKIFDQEQPDQILFSLLEHEICIGYGGLVHINWRDKHSELSFIMNTVLEQDRFQEIWLVYLKMIEKAAFHDLNLHKIFTYAFDVRPCIYSIFEKSGYNREAELIDHCYIDGRFRKVVIHSKFNPL